MNKALFRDRAKKLMLTGVLAGVIAGVAITSGISSITLKKAEKKLEISNAKLQEQTKKNEELQAELEREEVTENTAELLASDDDRWCLALVNEKHPLDIVLMRNREMSLIRRCRTGSIRDTHR